MESFSRRLRMAMDKVGISQSELCKRTAIPKSAISQYLSGGFKPKQTRTAKLAEALNVSEAWLMGFDVPAGRQTMRDEINPITFCENLYNLMKENNVDTGMLSLDMGFDQKDIASWLSGKTVPPSDIVLSLANYFGVDTTALTNTMQRTRFSFSAQRMAESPGPAIVMGHGGPGGQRRVGAPRKQLLELYDILNDMTDQQLKVVADLAKNLKDMAKKGK